MSERLVRPKNGAQQMGLSDSEFWRRAEEDPDFPELIKLSPRITVMRGSEVDRYIKILLNKGRPYSKRAKRTETTEPPAAA